MIEPAPGTVKPRETAGQKSASQEAAEFLLDEPRQAVATVRSGHIGTERLEMVTDDLVQHALRRRLWRMG